MNITTRVDQSLNLKVKRSELGELGMLMDWIVDNYRVMDKAMISMNQEEILPAVRKWSETVQTNL